MANSWSQDPASLFQKRKIQVSSRKPRGLKPTGARCGKAGAARKKTQLWNAKPSRKPRGLKLICRATSGRGRSPPPKRKFKCQSNQVASLEASSHRGPLWEGGRSPKNKNKLGMPNQGRNPRGLKPRGPLRGSGRSPKKMKRHNNRLAHASQPRGFKLL